MDQEQALEERANHQRERAIRLLKEAVDEAGIRDSSEYEGSPEYFARYWNIDPKYKDQRTKWPERAWEVFKVDYPDDVILLVQINRHTGVLWIETGLYLTAIDLVRGAERILDAPDAHRVFKIESDKDRNEAIDFNVRSMLVNFINHLPPTLVKALEAAYEDSIQRQVKTSVEPFMRDHWRLIGIPDDFNCLAAWERPSNASKLEEFRNIFVGETKPEIPETLPQLYKELHLGYKAARKHHNESRDVFLASHRQGEGAWHDYWDDNCLKMFPNLAYYCLMMLCDEGHLENGIVPRELAYKHLSFLYARSPEYLRKKVSELRGVARDKKRRQAGKVETSNDGLSQFPIPELTHKSL
ncbi:MAG TPA: hypothetical protein VN643_21355 [Pyrinomonadaceae bacterium]|nr:hypothetical protein [Pyrinomonadaceae bacterium]